ncbi:MAG TPA: hypothetical protein VI540_00740 [Gaiellaceae bacterium]|nr:hypothetical protein [Gaiellaceae bacterium]
MKPLGWMLAATAVAGALAVAAAAQAPGWSTTLSITPTVVTQGQIPEDWVPTEGNLHFFGTVTGPAGDTFGIVNGYEGSRCAGERIFQSDEGERTLTGGDFARWLTQDNPDSWQAGPYSFQGEVYGRDGLLKAKSACVVLTIMPPAGHPGWSISLSVAPAVVRQGGIPGTVVPKQKNPHLFGTVTGPPGDTYGIVNGYAGSTCAGETIFQTDDGERTLTGGDFTRWLTQEAPRSWRAGVYSFLGEVYTEDGHLAAESACVVLTIKPPAKVVKPVIGSPTTTPGRAIAGKRLTVSFPVTRSDNGAPLTSGTMVCAPSVRGKVIGHDESFRGGIARLSFTIPRSAQGKLLKVKLTIRLGSQATTRVASFHVR